MQRQIETHTTKNSTLSNLHNLLSSTQLNRNIRNEAQEKAAQKWALKNANHVESVKKQRAENAAASNGARADRLIGKQNKAIKCISKNSIQIQFKIAKQCRQANSTRGRQPSNQAAMQTSGHSHRDGVECHGMQRSTKRTKSLERLAEAQ